MIRHPRTRPARNRGQAPAPHDFHSIARPTPAASRTRKTAKEQVAPHGHACVRPATRPPATARTSMENERNGN